MERCTCELCKKPIDYSDLFRIGKWDLCSTCYDIVVKRMTHFKNVLLVLEDEWEEWLEEIE